MEFKEIVWKEISKFYTVLFILCCSTIKSHKQVKHISAWKFKCVITTTNYKLKKNIFRIPIQPHLFIKYETLYNQIKDIWMLYSFFVFQRYENKNDCVELAVVAQNEFN